MDAGLYTFALVIPPNFQRDVLAGRSPAVQLNVERHPHDHLHRQWLCAGRSSPAKSISFVKRYRGTDAPPWYWRCTLNPALDKAWFGCGGADHQRHHTVHHPDRRSADPGARAPAPSSTCW